MTRRWQASLWEEFERHVHSRHARRLLNRRGAVIESLIVDAEEDHGLHRAKLRGRRNMLVQALLTVAVLNIKQLARQSPVPQAGVPLFRGSPPLKATPLFRRSSARFPVRLDELA